MGGIPEAKGETEARLGTHFKRGGLVRVTMSNHSEHSNGKVKASIFVFCAADHWGCM